MPSLAPSRQRSRGFAGVLGTPGAAGRAVGAVPDEWPLRMEMRSERGFGWRLFRRVGERLSVSIHSLYATRWSMEYEVEEEDEERGCEGTDKTKIAYRA